MRFFLNRCFVYQLDDHDLDQAYIRDVLDDITQGRSIPLGHKLYKIRAGRKGEGKSGGFRNIFFWKRDEFIIFCYLFPKNKQGNIRAKDFKALCILADEYARLTTAEIARLLTQKSFVEVAND